MKHDVALVLATMSFLQASYYAISGIVVAVCAGVFSIGGGSMKPTIRALFLCQDSASPFSSQLVILVAKFLSIAPMTALVSLSVDNVSAVGDFVMTVYGFHFVVCWICFGFPPVLWWIATGAEVAVMLTACELAVARKVRDELFVAAERIERPVQVDTS